MIVADPDGRPESQSFLPCAQCGPAGPGEEVGMGPSRQLSWGPSVFIPAEEVLQGGSGGREEPALGAGAGPANIAMVMGLHPHYRSSFWKMQDLLLRMDGALPCHWRHYIAIMAAARHRCSYLVGFHTAEFLRVGGDPGWLRGVHRAPEKLRGLSEVNKLLAHRPWLLTCGHIEALLKPGEHSWSLAELTQALVLLTHHHALASFVFGCGILPEREPAGTPTSRDSPPHGGQRSPPGRDDVDSGRVQDSDAAHEVGALMERMKQLQEGRGMEEGVASREEMENSFELEKTESLLVTPSADLTQPSLPPDMLGFVEDPKFEYQDFTRRGEQTPPTFRAQDYSWEDHGYSLISRLNPEVGQLLDEKFQAVCSLTYNTLATHRGVDTSVLRRAIWNYIHCVFGIRYDDYDYSEVNQLLERSLKLYIKTVACYPERTSRSMYSHCWTQFRHSEKVHVNLLLLEARMQAALLYALRAITRYMT
ncbi:sestrin-2 isoform X1 [Tachyglossus aculeatus]|uniref:sestrin-2 isoform X1 n=1 Tax=Tachyglossus aculeatus TaxID=9261 RepID=UPI0018F52458|nr:sestrin-2 isoform X1 [Tachyglossus aculeatus]